MPVPLLECWHLWTPENHPVIFKTEADFQTGMTVFGLCALLFNNLKILTFELMSNHVHITLFGQKASVMDFFTTFKKALGKALSDDVDLDGFSCSLRLLETEIEIRNSITYSNRNGFLVNPSTMPFTYPWGANRYFFNPEARLRFAKESSALSLRERRLITHSRFADKIERLRILDGYGCPLSFCDISSAEKYYRSASNYLYEISRNLESHKQFAEVIGESVFYTDDDLFRIAVSIAKDKYGETKLKLLSSTAKTDLTKILHYDYNATKKQLHRMISIDLKTLDLLFPGKQ